MNKRIYRDLESLESSQPVHLGKIAEKMDRNTAQEFYKLMTLHAIALQKVEYSS